MYDIASELAERLNELAEKYHVSSFCDRDPIQIPRHFDTLQDKEIAGFFAALFAWGRREIAIPKTIKLLAIMDNAPYQFIRDASEAERERLNGFVHRTFNDEDIKHLLRFLQDHYAEHTSLESAFCPPALSAPGMEPLALRHTYFRDAVFSRKDTPAHVHKHIGQVPHSAGKRINLFLRWMVRGNANAGAPSEVDMGLWKNISPAELIIPLDVHVLRQAAKFGLVNEKAPPTWNTAAELTKKLRQLNSKDPLIYDFALFGAGENESHSAKEKK